MLNVVDLFCGAGGLSTGFHKAAISETDVRYRIVYGVDYNLDAIKTYRASHFGHLTPENQCIVAPQLDIDKVTVDSIRKTVGEDVEIDVLVGGPSCQGVSAGGLRNPDDPRNRMLRAFITLVGELRPKWFVIENVPGLTHSNNRELLLEIFEQLTAIDGYRVAGDMLLAADYGVPQFRYRLFIIGTRTNNHIRFPAPTHSPLSLNENGQKKLPEIQLGYRTVWDELKKFNDIPPRYVGIEGKGEDIGLQEVWPNHVCVGLGDSNLRRITSIPEGKDWRSMPIGLLPERYFATRASDQKGAYGRLAKDWPAYTITNLAGNVTAGPFTHPVHNRSLSALEAALLQSFPEDYVFFGDLTSQYRQIGNAVPPKLAQAVAEAILYCHSLGEKAVNWGRIGRIDVEILRKVREGKRTFPKLTPRNVEPAVQRNNKRSVGKTLSKPKGKNQVIASVWEQEPRPMPSDVDAVATLRQLAKQAGNYRAAKRARAIVGFIEGKSREEIIREANTSEVSVRKWVDGFYAGGLDGWRAYHTSIAQITAHKPDLQSALEKALKMARRTLLAPSKPKDGSAPSTKRLHMNRYVLRLAEYFQNETVDSLTERVETMLGTRVGTVYVGDLLAIADVVLGVGIYKKRGRPSKKSLILDKLHTETDEAEALVGVTENE